MPVPTRAAQQGGMLCPEYAAETEG